MGPCRGGINLQQSSSNHFAIAAVDIRHPGEKPLAGKLAQGAVAQLGERLICIQEVVGSIPISSTRNKRRIGFV
jgi:hypothetical protein